MIICKMMGILKLTHRDIDTGGRPWWQATVHEFTEETKDTIKSVIDRLLFEEQTDGVLVNYNNQLYVCEAIDIATRRYARKNLTYHPMSDRVKL